MSRWISDNTKGTLSPEIDIDNEQIMSILNTIYFRDEWIDKFNEQETKPDTFYLSNGDKISCDFMSSKYSSYGFVKGNGFTSSSLPLKNSGSMMFILPDRGVSIDDLISTPEKAASIFDEKDAKRGKVIFKIPKFSFGSSLDLNNMLKTMGIKSAFEENANFTEITDHTAFISNIKQQTHLAIDEKGIEAAAFTKIDYVGSAPAKDEIAEMILDRPFIFVIKADSDTILFIGVINNPTQK
jgi:serpin B